MHQWLAFVQEDPPVARKSRPGDEDDEEEDDAALFQMQLALQSREDGTEEDRPLTSGALKRHNAVAAVPKMPPVKRRKAPPTSPGHLSSLNAVSPRRKRPAAASAARDGGGDVAAASSLGFDSQLTQELQPDDFSAEDEEAVAALKEWKTFLNSGWSGCVDAEELNFNDASKFGPLSAPKGKRPAIDSAKWQTAVQSLAPQLQVFHNLLVANTKPNDQALKSNATSLKNAIKGKPKKAGLKGDQVALMGDKLKALAELSTLLKTFRGAAMNQRAPQTSEQLEKLITGVAEQWGFLLVARPFAPFSWVSIPDVWIQSWISQSLSCWLLQTLHQTGCHSLTVIAVPYMRFWDDLMIYHSVIRN